MTKFQVHLALSVLAVVFAATYGDTISLFNQILRLKRDVSTQGGPDRTYASCREYRDCSFSGARRQAIIEFNMLDFVDAVDATRSLCKNYTGPPACGESPCTVDRSPFLTMLEDIFTWVCQHIDAFNSDSACWGSAFKRAMIDCFATRENSYLSYGVVRCWTNAAENLPGCDENDVEFVTGFMQRKTNAIRTMVASVNAKR